MKRLISLLTLISMLFAIAIVPVSADEDISFSLEQAIVIAKDKLQLNTDEKEFYSNYYENYYDGRNQWQLNWYSNTNGDSISVSVDAMTGEILSYSNWHSDAAQGFRKLPKYNKEEAKKAAEEFIIKLAGNKFNETKPFESVYADTYTYSETYNFTYNRYVDGIEYQNNNIFVSIDKNTLEVRQYNLIWDQGGFPESDKAISKEEVIKIFKEKLGLEMNYQLIYPTGSSEPKVMLVYTLKDGNLPIDAITGEVIYNSYYYSESPYFDKTAVSSSMTSEVVLTEKEQKDVDKNKTYITKEEALKAVMAYFPEVETLTMSNANLNPGWESVNAAWYISWSNAAAKESAYTYYSASVDAVTGELTSFYKDSGDIYSHQGEEPVYTEEQALDIAKEFLNKIQPDKFKLTEYKEQTVVYDSTYTVPFYSFNFVRKENDIFCPFNALYVSVDKFTGDITSYNYSWQEVEFPSASKAISLDKAYDMLFAKSDLVLKYLKQYTYRDSIQSSDVKLAYVLDDFYGLIDANTGTLIDYSGNPIEEVITETETFNDIAGNAAEADINLLVEAGIIQQTSEFKPNDKIQQKDFIEMLIKAIQPYDYYPVDIEGSNDTYYKQAISKKILTEREVNPDGYVSRQEAAKMLVRALGYGYIADKASIFIADFNDFDSIYTQYRGYAVIAEEISLIKLQDKNFNPKELLTRGDSATILVNFLKLNINE